MKRLTLFILTLLIGNIGFAENRTFQDNDFGITFHIPEGLKSVVDFETEFPTDVQVMACVSDTERAPFSSMLVVKYALDESTSTLDLKELALDLVDDFDYDFLNSNLENVTFGFDSYTVTEIPSKLEGVLGLRCEKSYEGETSYFDIHVLADDQKLLAIVTSVDSDEVAYLDMFSTAIMGSVEHAPTK